MIPIIGRQNKHIWPSADEVKAGRFQLHTDGKGGELALDPSPVYENANGNYKGKKNYSFTLTAYDANGDSIPTAPFNPVFHEGAEFLGTEEFWSIIDIPDGQLNGATGNVIVNEEDMSIDGRGPGLGLSRTFNSLDSSDHMFYFKAGMPMRKRRFFLKTAEPFILMRTRQHMSSRKI